MHVTHSWCHHKLNIFRQLLKFILLPCRWFMRLPSKTLLFFFYQKGESSLFHMLTYLSNLFWQNKSHVNMILKYDISIWYNNIVTMHIDQSLIIKNIIKLHSKSHLHPKITIQDVNIIYHELTNCNTIGQNVPLKESIDCHFRFGYKLSTSLIFHQEWNYYTLCIQLLLIWNTHELYIISQT